MVATLLRDSYKFYWQHVSYLAAIMLPLVIPMELINLLIQTTLVTDPSSFSQQVPSFMVTIAFYPIYQAALVLAVHQLLQGHKRNTFELYKRGSEFWFQIVLANVFFYLAFFGGLAMFIIPGFFFAIRLALMEQNVVLDQQSALEAMKSSWEDTSGQFMNILAGGLLIALPVVGVSMALFRVFNDIGDGSPVFIMLAEILSSLLYPLFVIYLIRVRHFIQHKE